MSDRSRSVEVVTIRDAQPDDFDGICALYAELDALLSRRSGYSLQPGQ